ncbi:MAG: class II aldolase/adducin family protein [Rhizobiales bacterium]|nr:class II aldolase/adducin family protein [Hyphomicrobiales bacterium]
MPISLDDVRRQLAIANRILGNEGVIDAFGHASVRHPGNPNRYFLARSRSPLFVEPADILEFDLDSEPVRPLTVQPYGERVIHGEIYKARPDVNAVVHHHSGAVLPFCMTGVPLVPLFHLGATMGGTVPFWDQRDDFGDTNLLVIKPEEGASLARALGNNWTVLMRRHGATIAGTTLQEVVFRSINGCLNAEYQLRAMAIGTIGPLNAAEAHDAGAYNLQSRPMARAWEYWTLRLGERGIFPARKKTAAQRPARAAASRAKTKVAPRKKTAAKRGRKR